MSASTPSDYAGSTLPGSTITPMARLYSDLKVLAHPDRLAALREGRLAAPVHVRIKPINRCNHNCWYCAYRSGALQLGDDMDLGDRIPEAKMFEIADDLVAMGVRAVTFSGGGEPTLYKPLPRVMERLAAGGIKIGSLTNGSNLKGAMADAFAAHASWVRVSVDGYDDASYAAARGLRGSPFSDLLERLAAFAQRRSQCVLGVSFIVGEGNAGHVFDACRQFREAGVNHVKLSGVVVGNDDAGNDAYHDRIRATVEAEIERAQSLATDRFAIVNHYHGLSGLFAKDYRSCPIMRFLTVIGADCRVYACQDKAYTASGCLGSIEERSFADFWFSAENRRALDAVDPSASCRHHCVAHHKNQLLHELTAIDQRHASFV